MPLIVPDPTLWTSPVRVGDFLSQDVDGLRDEDERSLAQACVDATAIVRDYLLRTDLSALAPEVQDSVLFVTTKVAARIYRNPSEVTVDVLGDATRTFADPRILTSDERQQLRRARSARLVRGPILMGVSDA